MCPNQVTLFAEKREAVVCPVRSAEEMTMSPEIYTMLGGFATLGVLWLSLFPFMWRITDRLDRKIDNLAKDHQTLARDLSALARELSELGGEIRGRFGKPEIQPAE